MQKKSENTSTLSSEKPKFNISPILNTELIEDEFELNDEQKSELTSFYQDVLDKFQIGKTVKGKIKTKVAIKLNFIKTQTWKSQKQL